MKIVTPIVAILLAGCATQEIKQVPETKPVFIYNPVVLDADCASLAKYFRAVSIMRDIGVKIDDVNYVLPKVPDYPVGTIQRTVYHSTDKDPTTTSNGIYTECVATGYRYIMDRYKVEEIVYNLADEKRIKDELETKRLITAAKVKKLQKKVIKK